MLKSLRKLNTENFSDITINFIVNVCISKIYKDATVVIGTNTHY